MCSVNDERIAYLATIEAKRSLLPMKHGCVAVSGGKIVARGYNSYRTYSKDGFIHDACSCHAEVDVIRKCIKQNIKHKINIYVVRVSSTGEYRNSAPCSLCVDTLKNNNVRSLVYSTDLGTLEKCKIINYKNKHVSGGERAISTNRVGFIRKGNVIIFKE